MTGRLHNEQAGFGLVELLVALAITSLIVVGIGGMFAFAGQLRDRSESTAAVQRTLLELFAISSALGERTGTRLTYAAATGFDIEMSPTGGEARDVQLYARIVLAADRLDILYTDANSSISVDLSAFETTRLEYFATSGQTVDWQPIWERSSAPSAVRLLTTKASWQWPVMLWLADRPDGS